MGRQLILVGAGGHAKVVISSALAAGWAVEGVVDDDPSSLQLVVSLVKALGFRSVVAAGGGAAALDRIADAQPNIVITDLVMPDIDGAALLSDVKRRNPEIVVLVMSVVDSVARAVQLLKSGADDYLTKPVTIDALAPRLELVSVAASSAPRTSRLRVARM